MKSWKHLLNLACFTKASVRIVTITRSTRDDVLNFHILGGSDTLANNGIFISKVEKNSKAYEAGLRRGDQVKYSILNFLLQGSFFSSLSSTDFTCQWSMFRLFDSCSCLRNSS